ncbi:thioester reductase domain-containing protein, partial [Nocardia sp. CNY236]|uniref:thioester reductase domain-containing protein n=1 Tax=Nocardia sp. CNY236 TaxID=1169152 RepID=UPI0005657B52
MTSIVVSRLMDHSERIGESIALQWLDDSGKLDAQRTYRELRTRVEIIAKTLIGPTAGLKPGDRALLAYGPGLDFVETFLACLATGIVAVPVHLPTTGSLLRRYSSIARDSDAAITLTTVEQLRTVTRSLRASLGRDEAEGLHQVDQVLDAPWLTTDDLTPHATDPGLDLAATVDAPAFLQYTSGTTGSPKGVVVTHRNLNHNLDAIARSVLLGFELEPEELVCVSWLPHNHDMGLIGSRLAPLYFGGRSVAFSPTGFLRDPGMWMEVCAREGATHTQAPDFALELCARAWTEERSRDLDGDLSALVSLIVAAETVRPATLRDFRDTFAGVGLAPRALCPTYGLAEHTLFVCSAQGREDEQWTEDTSRVGNGAVPPHAEIDLRIVGPDGVECVPGEVGEIWLDSPSKASGYWNRADVTEAQFNATLTSGHSSAAGYLRTGDLGFVDERGELFVTGRTKELIIVRGANVHPHDVEETIRLRLDGRLAMGSVVAFGVDSGRTEELVVLLSPDTADSHAQLAQDAMHAVASSHGIVPLEVMVAGRGSVPRTTSGKVQRHRLAERYAAGTIDATYSYNPRHTGHNAADRDEALTDTETRLRSLWSSILECSPESIGRSAEFDQLGGDSVRTVQLAASIRSEFSLDATVITERRLFRCRALWDMARVIDERRPDDTWLMNEQECHRERALAVAFLARIGVTRQSLEGKPIRAVSSDDRCVLVTGATGFFGSYMVSSILRSTPDTSIICLVRPKDGQSGMERVRKAMDSYGLWSEKFAHRVSAVEGDLGSPFFMLDMDSWHSLDTRVDEIFHCAADVDWVRPYEQLKKANVRGTQEVIRLAAQGAASKPLHLMSTLGIHSEQYMLEQVVAREADEPRPVGFETDYFASKWVADALAREAADRGMPIVIYRFDELTGDTGDGRLNLEGICARLIQGVTDVAAVPDIDVNYKLLPVDVVARSVLDISARAHADESVYGKAFHLLSWNFTTLPRLWDMLREKGYRLEQIPFASWCDRLAHATPDNALYPLLPYIRQIHIDRWLAAKANGTRFGIENVISVLDEDELDRSVQASTEAALWMTIDYLLDHGSLRPPVRAVSKHLVVTSSHAIPDEQLASAVSSAFRARWPEQWPVPQLDLEITRHRGRSSSVTTVAAIGAADPPFSLNAQADLVEHDGFCEVRVMYPEVLEPGRPDDPQRRGGVPASDREAAATPFDWMIHDGTDLVPADVESRVSPHVAARLSAIADAAAVAIDDILVAAFGVLLGRCDWQSEHQMFSAVSLGGVISGVHTEHLQRALTTSLQNGSSRRVFTAVERSASFLDLTRSLMNPAHQAAPTDALEVVVRRGVAKDAGSSWHIVDVSEPRVRDRALTLDIDLRADEWLLRWNYDVSRIDRGSVVRLAEGFEAVSSAVAAMPDSTVGELPVMSPEAREQVLIGFNASVSTAASQVAATTCLHELVVDQARRTPNRIAVVTEESQLTFEQLVGGAAMVADELATTLGVTVESRVAVLIGRCNEAAVGLLAASIVGAAYVPLDPDIPVSRLAYMARDAACSAVLVVDDTAAILDSHEWDVDLPVVHVDWILARGPVSIPERLPVDVSPSNAVYVLYTSGSTGMPKGVVVEHRNVVNMLQDSSFEELTVERYARWLQSCSLGFCLHVLMWHPLTRGGSVRMVRSLADHIPGDVDAVSISLSALEAIDLPDSVKAVYIAGEKRTVRSVEQVGARRLYDAYGATETIVGVGGFVESPFDDHVGRPLANTQIYVLDGNRNPVPIGVRGEIYLAGAGIAREYVNRPELTAQRFMDNPFAAGRMYRTGDLGCWLPSGQLRVFGRIDDQVKVHGCRVELKEVQAAIHDGDEGVVSAHVAV